MAAMQKRNSGLLDVLEADVDPAVSAVIEADVDATNSSSEQETLGQVGDSEILFDDNASVSSVKSHDQASDTKSIASSTDPFKMYPHWERQLLNDKVTLQPRDENPLERLKKASRLSLASSESSATGSVSSDEYRTAATSASSVADKEESFSTYTSPFTHSFAFPHLPLATSFPSFASQAKLLKSESNLSLPSLSRSFAHTMYSPQRPSTMHCMPGVDNQVQGPIQNRCIWNLSHRTDKPEPLNYKHSFLDFATTNDLAVDDVDALQNCAFVMSEGGEGIQHEVSKTFDEDEIRRFILEQWPLLGEMRRTKSAFEIPVRERVSSLTSIADSETACTCGHHQQILLAPPSTAVENLNGHADSRRSDISSQSSTRAIASILSTLGSHSARDSRTSSDFYLSPDFPDRESGISGGNSSAHVTLNTDSTMSSSSSSMLSTSSDDRDAHRAGAPGSPGSAGARFRNFLRRVSGLGNKKDAHQMRGRERNTRWDSASSLSLVSSVSSSRPRAPSPPSPKSRKGLDSRGRSYTVRPLSSSAPDLNADDLTPRPSHFQGAQDDISYFPVPASRQRREQPIPTGERPARRRGLTTAAPGFVRRLSAHLRFPSLGNSSSDKAEPVTAVNNESVSATPLPMASDLTGTLSGNGEGARSPGILFRNFKLSGPRFTGNSNGRH